jgi:hypothetical protein
MGSDALWLWLPHQGIQRIDLAIQRLAFASKLRYRQHERRKDKACRQTKFHSPCCGTKKPIMNTAGPGMNGTISVEIKEKSRRRLSSAWYAAQVAAGGSASTFLTGPLLRN